MNSAKRHPALDKRDSGRARQRLSALCENLVKQQSKLINAQETTQNDVTQIAIRIQKNHDSVIEILTTLMGRNDMTPPDSPRSRHSSMDLDHPTDASSHKPTTDDTSKIMTRSQRAQQGSK